MTKYSCIPTEDFKFKIKEEETGMFIAASLFADECKKYLGKLNKGAAFNGKTPSFFCDPVLSLD